MDSVGRKIYLAGKFTPDNRQGRDWRLDIVQDLDTCMHGHYPRDHAWPVLESAIFGRFDYTGPFFTDLSDTSGGHGGGLAFPHATNVSQIVGWKHGGDTPYMREQVVQRCLLAIRRADLVFAWIDSLDCYGTIFELGYAKALGKRLAVCFAGGDFYRGNVETLAEDGQALDPLYELWFTSFACQAMECAEGPVEALQQAIAELGWDVFPDTFASPLEAMFAEEWRNQSLHLLYPLVSQHAVKNGAYRLDFAFPRLELGIELDGYTYHSDREAFNSHRPPPKGGGLQLAYTTARVARVDALP